MTNLPLFHVGLASFEKPALRISLFIPEGNLLTSTF